MKKLIILAAVSLTVTACATTDEMPIAPNMVRIDTQASGLAFTGSVGRVTMKKAAEATIKRGYTHFKIADMNSNRGQRLVGMNSNSYGTFNANTMGKSTYGTYSGFGSATPTYAPTASVGATVIMYRANEAGAKGAWNAAEVLKKEGNV